MKNEKNVKSPLNNMENCHRGLEYALSKRLEIHPCVLQDIGPLGAATQKVIVSCRNSR